MKKNNRQIEPEFKKGLTEEEINSPEFDPDDFAPAPDKEKAISVNESLENKRNALAFALFTALFALIIGLCGWGASRAVNAYHSSLTEKNVLSLFKNCDRAEEYKINNEEHDVYAVFFKDKVAGFAVTATREGFGGDIDLIVAFGSDNKISDIKVVKHNESRGLGSLVAGEDFLSQFKGNLVGKENITCDTIAGATTSSAAVKDAVSAVLGLGLSTESIADELGCETITAEEIEEEVKKDEEEKDPSETTDKADTTDGRPGVGDFQGGQNSNNGNGDMDLDGEDITTVYDTETTAPDEEETTGPAESSGPAEESSGPAETSGPAEDSSTVPPESETTADTTSPETTVPETTVGETTTAQTPDTPPVEGGDQGQEPVQDNG